MKQKLLLFAFIFTMLNADGYEDITKKQYGKKWAFTVDKVKIGCEMMLAVVFVEGDDYAYGLTGMAADAVGRNIDNIWKDSTEIKGTKIDLTIFINKALSHCD